MTDVFVIIIVLIILVVVLYALFYPRSFELMTDIYGNTVPELSGEVIVADLSNSQKGNSYSIAQDNNFELPYNAFVHVNNEGSWQYYYALIYSGKILLGDPLEKFTGNLINDASGATVSYNITAGINRGFRVIINNSSDSTQIDVCDSV